MTVSKRANPAQEGGAVYNFTGPQGFGIANMADSLYAIRKLVFEEKQFTLGELKEALDLELRKRPGSAVCTGYLPRAY